MGASTFALKSRVAVGIVLFFKVSLALQCANAATDDLDLVVSQIKRLELPSETSVLAATASTEGHWTFANVRGERFTCSTHDEMKRMPSVLAPEIAGENKLRVVLTEASAFTSRDSLAMCAEAGKVAVVYAYRSS